MLLKSKVQSYFYIQSNTSYFPKWHWHVKLKTDIKADLRNYPLTLIFKYMIKISFIVLADLD